MSRTRNGKIARLPKHIRHQLNRRLEDAWPGKQIVAWLNEQPEVLDVLKWQFNGRPITEQNLSEWRKTGYRDWLAHQETCDLVQRLSEQAEDLQDLDGGPPLSDRFAALLTVEVVRLSEALLKESNDPVDRWQRLREILQELGQLRRGDHRAARLQMDQDRWSREADELDRQNHERDDKAMKKRVLAPIMSRFQLATLAEAFGGGELGRKIAAVVVEIQEDLAPGTLFSEPPAPPSPTGSIQPNPSQSK